MQFLLGTDQRGISRIAMDASQGRDGWRETCITNPWVVVSWFRRCKQGWRAVRPHRPLRQG